MEQLLSRSGNPLYSTRSLQLLRLPCNSRHWDGSLFIAVPRELLPPNALKRVMLGEIGSMSFLGKSLNIKRQMRAWVFNREVVLMAGDPVVEATDDLILIGLTFKALDMETMQPVLLPIQDEIDARIEQANRNKCPKKSYATNEMAQADLRRMNLKHWRNPAWTILSRSYKCDKCGKYHLTKGRAGR